MNQWMKLIFVFILAMLVSISAEAAVEPRLTIEATDPLQWLRYSVKENGEEIMSFDLEAIFKERNLILVNYYQRKPPPLSPDGRYFPFVAPEEGVLLVDPANRGFKWLTVPDKKSRHYIDTDLWNVSWVNAQKLHIVCHNGRQHVLFDIETGESSAYRSQGPSLTFDHGGVNRAWAEGSDLTLRVSMWNLEEDIGRVRCWFMRYNGYWVYPKPITGYMTGQERDNCFAVTPDPRKYPELAQKHYGMDRHYALSAPAFIGDTAAIAFVEQIYPIGDYKTILETNLIVLDAHRANSNPVSPDAIRFIKKKIPPIAAPEGYLSLSIDVTPVWNKTESRLEIWRSYTVANLAGRLATASISISGEIPPDSPDSSLTPDTAGIAPATSEESSRTLVAAIVGETTATLSGRRLQILDYTVEHSFGQVK